MTDLETVLRTVAAHVPVTDSFKGVDYYEEYRRVLGPSLSSIRSILELGIAEGASLLAWSLLCPSATIIGVDRHVPPGLMAAIISLHLEKRVVTLETEHQNIDRIRGSVHGPVDLIVDDGSHRLHPTIDCFYGLFDLLASGGWYAIEDWGAGYWESFGGPNAGVHRLLYALVDEAAWADRLKPEAGRYRLAGGEPLPLRELRVSALQPIAFVQRR